ncbi:MAG: hypothetical protein MUO38_11855 [Anaerolineales bacterium]|nr:hypothetical protein [Anaerolineales bacterium]
MGWLGLRPNHPMYCSLLRARGLFISLLGRTGAPVPASERELLDAPDVNDRLGAVSEPLEDTRNPLAQGRP